MLIHCPPLNTDWENFLQPILTSDSSRQLFLDLQKLRQTEIVLPPNPLVFQAFNLCPLKDLKVVIIGQDPYHGPGQANGLSFSVNPGIKFPPSLKNIFKELSADIPSFRMPFSGNLENWAQQGVLLLNAILTVKANTPASHRFLGWEKFTDAVIQSINDNCSQVVFLLWGNYAQSKSQFIDGNKHLVLKAAHPSPLARGAFFGCQHFSKTNAYLSEVGKSEINWELD